MVNISFIGTNTIENLIDGKVNLGGTINWTSDTVSGGTDYTINKLQGTPKPLFFKVSQGRTIKTLSDTKVQSVQTVETGTTDGSGNISVSGNYFSESANDYTVFLLSLIHI